MNRTTIEWVKNPDGTQGYTWNPITGCLGPNGTPEKPNRCSYCYAHKLAKGRLKHIYFRVPVYLYNYCPARLIPHTDKSDPFVPRFWRHRLKEPSSQKSRGIFICSMGELFGDWIPRSWQEDIFNQIENCPQHRFQILTKRPENIPWDEMPDNVWLGVTITGEESDEEQLRLLEQLVSLRATLHFVSFEPLLGPIASEVLDMIESFDVVRWVIVGAQTQPVKLPKMDWINEIIDCVWYESMGRVALFMKNNLRKMAPAIKEFQEWELGDGMIQEFPK